MIAVFQNLILSDLKVLYRNKVQWIHAILFFILFISLFGIGLGFDNDLLMKISPAVIWITFLFVTLFTIESIFKEELEQGALEQLLISPYPLWWLILAKSVAIWIASALPLMLVMPLMGCFMQLPLLENIMLWVSLLLGSPALTLIGMMGASLTASLPRSGIFLGLLILPLYIPILLLGESTAILLRDPQWPIFQMSLLTGISILSITLAPHAAGSAIKISMG